MQAGDLKLKFVAHVGDVAFQKVKRFTELAGVDVILVHRLLKNTVPLREYVLMSEPLHEELASELGSIAVPVEEHLEGLGEARNYYVDLDVLGGPHTIEVRPSIWRKLAVWARMTFRSIPYFLGLKKACDGFRHMGEVLPPVGTRPSAAPDSGNP
jgi:hypothetical protein